MVELVDWLSIRPDDDDAEPRSNWKITVYNYNSDKWFDVKNLFTEVNSGKHTIFLMSSPLSRIAPYIELSGIYSSMYRAVSGTILYRATDH